MTTISETLRDKNNRLRISNGDRWLIADWDGWTVFEKKPYQRGVTVVYQGPDEADAVAALLAEE